MSEDTTNERRPKKRRSARWRRHLRFTREGRVFVFVTFALGFAAVNTGTNLMYLMFGFMLSLIVLSGILSEHVLRKLSIERRLPRRAFAGEPALVELAVKNGKQRLVSYSVEVEDQAIDEKNDRRCYYLKIAPGEEQVATYRRVPLKRGPLHFAGFRVATRFPFSLFEKWRELDEEAELLVYPALLPTVLPSGTGKEEGDQAGVTKGRGTETRELRDYRVDDEVRSIHWRRTASRGKPVVRVFEREAALVLAIVVDNGTDADPALHGVFEESVSRAAYLAERALTRGFSVEICARGSRSALLAGGSPPDALWRYLAMLEETTSEKDLASATRGARIVDMRTIRTSKPGQAA
jgi:uncharacterized protein (DUF58 family)